MLLLQFFGNLFDFTSLLLLRDTTFHLQSLLSGNFIIINMYAGNEGGFTVKKSMECIPRNNSEFEKTELSMHSEVSTILCRVDRRVSISRTNDFFHSTKVSRPPRPTN